MASLKSAGRTLLAVLAGMAAAIALVVAVEMLSALVHPLPAAFQGDMGEHVKRYPHWVLAGAALAWGATAAIATWISARIGNVLAGAIVALLLAWALVFNLTHLPYFTWFKVAMLVLFPVCCLLGILRGRRVEPTARPQPRPAR